MQVDHHNITGIVPTIGEAAEWAIKLGFGMIIRPSSLEHTAKAVVSTGSKQLEQALVPALTGQGWAFTCSPIQKNGDKAIFTILVRLT